jgi:hypothetical protein
MLKPIFAANWKMNHGPTDGARVHARVPRLRPREPAARSPSSPRR